MTRILIIGAFLLTANIIKCQSPLWKLKFKSTEIYKWRVYYDRGNVVDSLNLNKPVFAIEGDSAKLKTLGIDTLLNKIFDALRHSKIKKRTWTSNRFDYKGKPEHISIWWQTKDDRNYHRIDVILKESPNIQEEKFNYVLVSVGPFANDQTIHYIERKDVMTVVSIMNYMANNNWGNNYVKHP